ncbi:ATP-binding protein [uncultured Parabacteroides sp.]|uniref:ATP-binding protein n=2 Tax=Bacteroidales TaxID=171549 RepID=UPI0025968D55|nr:ATP-binding protein [uncultured Parabacteroides sp.]
MKFVDRIDEAARLKDALVREKSSLVVMYGRRRLGKSTLIKRVLSDNDVYFLADRSEGQHQRALLAKVIAQVFPDFDKLTYPDWESMFRAVNYRTDKHFTLCLDEFPYLVEQSSELPSVLQKLVDEKQLKYNLVLCGSSQNMMYGLFLDSTAPLYGRADEIMKLAPIRLPYIQEALSFDAMNTIEEYAVWGGVPRYWELRENQNSLDEKNAKKSLYKIADPFMAFYYQFVVPNRSFIELGRRLPIEQALTAHFSEYVSMQWEKLCRDAVTGNLVNRVVYGKAKRWWGSVLNEDKKPEQVEFDVMAESLDKKYLLVGECKWTTQENGKQLTAELLRKANLLPFAKNYTIVPMLFLKNAPKDDAGNAMLPENVVELMK